MKCLPLSKPKANGDKGDSGKEPKLHQVEEWREKNLGRNHAQSGNITHLANKPTVYDYDSVRIRSQKSVWIVTFRILSSSIWYEKNIINLSIIKDL